MLVSAVRFASRPGVAQRWRLRSKARPQPGRRSSCSTCESSDCRFTAPNSRLTRRLLSFIGLISAAGGTQGLQVVNTMEFSVRSLRGWAVPYVVPVPQATRVFADSGAVQDEMVEQQLQLPGAEVVRVAKRFARDPALHRQGECDDAAGRVVMSG